MEQMQEEMWQGHSMSLKAHKEWINVIQKKVVSIVMKR